MSHINLIYGHSPHSSSGAAGSSEGTPDTRFTAFSPEDAHPVKSTGQNSTPQRATQHDPFISTSTRNKAEQKLSATASDFKPYSQNVGSNKPSNYAARYCGTYSATDALPKAAENLRNLIDQMPTYGCQGSNAHQSRSTKAASQSGIMQIGTFSTDTSATRCLQVTSVYKNHASVHQTVLASLENLKKLGFKPIGSERLESGANAILIRFSNINDAIELYTGLKLDLPRCAVEYVSPIAFASAVDSPSKGSYSAHEGQVLLTASYPIGTPCNKKVFEDGLIGALSAEGDLFAWQKQAATEAGTYRMVAEYCDATVALHAVERLNREQIKLPQGDVVLVLELHTPDIQQTSHKFGRMMNPTRYPTEQSNFANLDGLISYNSAPSFLGQHEGFPSAIPSPSVLPFMAPNAAGFGLRPTPVPLLMDGMYRTPLAVSHGYPAGIGHIGGSDFKSFPYNGFDHNNLATAQNGYDNGINQFGLRTQSYQQGFGHYSTLANHRSGVYHGRSNARHQYAAKATNHGHRYNNGLYSELDFAAGQHNQVDTHRIKQGIDVRTTVMLRNIPNKIDQYTLKQIVDESSFGRYDFMYLRIDFSNNCNVGYAFINFVDPLDIIDFVMTRSNQKWYMFKSDKVAEISYATIQGRDCLIQKFRNSSVMLEPAHYRPKLFFTIHDAGVGPVGEEEDFPPSDNSSKLRRSCENAEHVGLFAPNAGQQLRDDQRHRRSQFDRGTSLAEREENYYDNGSLQVQRPSYPTNRGHMHH